MYLLRTSAGTLYAGLTTDLNKRLRDHRESKKGAKYTRAFGAEEIVYYEEFPNRSEASKREYQIKQLSRKEKMKLIGTIPNAEN